MNRITLLRDTKRNLISAQIRRFDENQSTYVCNRHGPSESGLEPSMHRHGHRHKCSCNMYVCSGREGELRLGEMLLTPYQIQDVDILHTHLHPSANHWTWQVPKMARARVRVNQHRATTADSKNIAKAASDTFRHRWRASGSDCTHPVSGLT
jgi:hypothetical protein